MPSAFATPPLVALLTDFGTRDWYVGAMKGVMLARRPDLRMVDITHRIPHGDITAGAYALSQCWRCFPEGAVFLGVVDPGVGTPRRPVAVRAEGRSFVGPDNGLFSFLPQEAREVRLLEHPSFAGPGRSTTFHGRDLFAPAAAALAGGLPFEDAGASCDGLLALDPDPFTDSPASWQVVYVDHFGNAVTNLPAAEVDALSPHPPPRFGVGAASGIPLVQTYGDAAPGEVVALVGSTGYLEFAVNLGSAAQKLGLRPGDPVRIPS